MRLRPGGTLELTTEEAVILAFQASLRDADFSGPRPGTEVPGYFQSSLTGRILKSKTWLEMVRIPRSPTKWGTREFKKISLGKSRRRDTHIRKRRRAQLGDVPAAHR